MDTFSIDLTLFPDSMDAYIVGGSLRDYFLNRPIVDYDIVVGGNAETYADELSLKLHGHSVKLGKSGQEIYRVISEKGLFDISPMSGGSIETDLYRRDFSINAMAYSLSTGEAIDMFGGRDDLNHKTIRMVSKDIFRNDPIRLLRAFRIGALLDFNIESETMGMIKRESKRICKTAGERVREELLKLMKTSVSHSYLGQMADSGLLLNMLPELEEMKGCTQNQHHSHDVFDHTMMAYFYLEDILNTLDQVFSGVAGSVAQTIIGKRAALLKWSILLHDVGKPATRVLDPKRGVHFHGHSRKSAENAQVICDRLRFSNQEKWYVDRVIRHHTQPLSLYIAHGKQMLTRKGMTRFFVKCKDVSPDLLLHSFADMKGKGKDARNVSFRQFIQTMLDDFYAVYLPQTYDSPLISGHDLIKEFGLAPSPLFKTILKEIEESRLSGTLRSKDAALTHVKKILKGKIGSAVS